MGPVAAFWHLLNFFAPAAALAVYGGCLLAWMSGQRLGAAAIGWRIALNFALGAGVLVAGLLLLGRDGRMLTYAALVLVVGSVLAFQTRR
ncbi:hypothetical protein EDC62_2296 [Tibeticola sediminis]|uniref:Uncharacterized protein n=1 Tax=Tibeticola sediminis TaxID=1917811 RepID=A0A3N4UH35_9BURK|nr:hypothetical protein [Tibeticola sediminis]RPE64477.1 hypothetical protein EDC62_2296 [Tibeticola sediminis]